MSEVVLQNTISEKESIPLAKDRAYYIFYLITIILPLIVSFCFYNLVLRARLFLGHWPVYGEGIGPSFGPLDLFSFMIPLLGGIQAAMICIPVSIVMTIIFFFKKSIFSYKRLAFLVSLIVINIVAINGIFSNFKGWLDWFAD